MLSKKRQIVVLQKRAGKMGLGKSRRGYERKFSIYKNPITRRTLSYINNNKEF